MTTHGDESSAINRAIGSRVNWYLRYAGDRHTQTELGLLLGLDQSAVSKKLNGARPFYLPELYAIAKWLERPVSDFLPAADELLSAPPMPAPRPPRTRRRAVAAAAVRGVVVEADTSQGTRPDTGEYRPVSLAA